MSSWLKSQIERAHRTLPRQMYKYKSQYALSNLEEALESDAKNNCEFGLDEGAVLCQIETSMAHELIKLEPAILSAMEKLFPEQKHRLLLVQDAENGFTTFITNSKSVVAALRRTPLLIKDTGSSHRFTTDKIVMRKSVQQIVLVSTR